SWHEAGTSESYEISPAGFQFSTFADTTLLSVAAGAVAFPYDRTVILVCEAMDTEGNRSRKDIPFHTQKFDEDSPLLQMIFPLTDAEVERHLAEFVFDLWDTTTYVVPDSIQVTLQKNTHGRNGDFEYNEWFFSTVDQSAYSPEIEIQPDGSKRLRIHCVAPEDNPFAFNWNDEFSMRVTAHDSCSNWLDTTLRFQVQTDILPPEITDEYPEWGSVENDPNTGFSFTLFDELAGLDTSSIIMELAIRHRFEEIPTPSNWTSGDTLIIGEDIRITDSVVEAGIIYELTYEFVNTEHVFDYNQIVGIRILARDLVPVGTNILDTVYSFYTEAKLPDLSIVSILKEARNPQIGDSVTISAVIKNEFIRINQPVTVAFVIDESDGVFRQTIQPPFEANSSVMTLPPIRLPLNSQGRLNIVITVDDEDLIEELDETNNEFEISVDVEGGELVVISDPFTPNGDGMNDIAAFYCEEFKLDDPVIKIYDVRGKLVRELRELTADKRFLWDGRDTNMNRLTTGAYLYILIDNAIPLKRGSVTLIR
ncbi:gliding motility-associated C-terminal domain-containing protein, partial [bacterium]|nr:gliding motility-associated C-terminal domain-containing protein [bacterium]